uniref:Bm13487 n=1 Tax=Brugia malayi TaxID=6279 RepID=A0A1I9G2Y0_BRUMA|nr:Bm13487 [Brugia malayi]
MANLDFLGHCFKYRLMIQNWPNFDFFLFVNRFL